MEVEAESEAVVGAKKKQSKAAANIGEYWRPAFSISFAA